MTKEQREELYLEALKIAERCEYGRRKYRHDRSVTSTIEVPMEQLVWVFEHSVHASTPGSVIRRELELEYGRDVETFRIDARFLCTMMKQELNPEYIGGYPSLAKASSGPATYGSVPEKEPDSLYRVNGKVKDGFENEPKKGIRDFKMPCSRYVRPGIFAGAYKDNHFMHGTRLSDFKTTEEQRAELEKIYDESLFAGSDDGTADATGRELPGEKYFHQAYQYEDGRWVPGDRLPVTVGGKVRSCWEDAVKTADLAKELSKTCNTPVIMDTQRASTTGRMSSKKPNVANTPKGITKLTGEEAEKGRNQILRTYAQQFLPIEDFVDQSQVELRNGPTFVDVGFTKNACRFCITIDKKPLFTELREVRFQRVGHSWTVDIRSLPTDDAMDQINEIVKDKDFGVDGMPASILFGNNWEATCGNAWIAGVDPRNGFIILKGIFKFSHNGKFI